MLKIVNFYIKKSKPLNNIRTVIPSKITVQIMDKYMKLIQLLKIPILENYKYILT
ncbi:hypothetical protein UNSWDHB_317 [Dehalobacter sp. UNSWDHB]|nr:hypothetical protein UNSWDHB_317 [Dehalobacter sp. UNSWDHB]